MTSKTAKLQMCGSRIFVTSLMTSTKLSIWRLQLGSLIATTYFVVLGYIYTEQKRNMHKTLLFAFTFGQYEYTLPPAKEVAER